MDFSIWMGYQLLLIVLFLTAVIYFVRSQHLNRTVQYSIIAVVSIIVLVLVSSIFGYYYFILGFIEWSTNFVLPWLVLYWLVRAVKIYENKS